MAPSSNPSSLFFSLLCIPSLSFSNTALALEINGRRSSPRDSSAGLLVDSELNGDLRNFFLSFGFASECHGQHSGNGQGANLGDGKLLCVAPISQIYFQPQIILVVNEPADGRNSLGLLYGDPQLGACQETIKGGNHFCYWVQNGNSCTPTPDPTFPLNTVVLVRAPHEPSDILGTIALVRPPPTFLFVIWASREPSHGVDIDFAADLFSLRIRARPRRCASPQEFLNSPRTVSRLRPRFSFISFSDSREFFSSVFRVPANHGARATFDPLFGRPADCAVVFSGSARGPQ
ncbi:hypothetical protein B0H10DRAFT_2213307 [Mycena sp. CBHHK59/15]|nr:hypothetical protein B0H10DRAFT_2213307 [Mycena sp. CBHHK59/15]